MNNHDAQRMVNPSPSSSMLKELSTRHPESFSRNTLGNMRAKRKFIGDESGREPTVAYTDHNNSLSGLANDLSDRDINLRHLQRAQAQYASDAGLPEMREAALKYGAQRQQHAQLYGLASQGQISSPTKRKFANRLNVVEENHGSSLPRIPTREHHEDEMLYNMYGAHVVRSKQKRKPNRVERVPPIHQDQRQQSTSRRRIAKDSGDLVFLDDGVGSIKAQYGVAPAVATNRRIPRHDWDYGSLVLANDRSTQILADSAQIESSSHENSKERLEGTRRRMPRQEHPAYSTDLEARDAQAIQGRRNVRNLKPVSQGEEFETDDDVHGTDEPRTYVHIQEFGPSSMHRRTFAGRDEKGHLVYPSIVSKPTQRAIESLERVYAPVNKCQHSASDCPHCALVHPKGNQNIIMRSYSRVKRHPSGLRHQKESTEVQYNSTVPEVKRPRHLDDGAQVLALSPTPTGKPLYLKKSPISRDVSQPSFQTSQPRHVGPQRKQPQKFVNAQPHGRTRRNIQDFLAEYDSSAQRSVTLKKQIVKHTMVQARHFLTATQGPAVAQEPYADTRNAAHATVTPLRSRQQREFTKIQAKSNLVNRHGNAGLAPAASRNRVGPITGAGAIARGSMSNSSIQNIDPSAEQRASYGQQQQQRLEKLFSEQDRSNEVQRTPAELLRAGRTNSQYSEGHSIHMRSEEKGGKPGAMEAFGPGQLSHHTDHIGSYDLDQLERPAKMFEQRPVPQQAENPQTILTPDQPAREMASKLQSNQKRLSQTPNDFSKNVKKLKQRNQMAHTRQAREVRGGSIFHAYEASPEPSLNIESGSVHFIKGESRKSIKDQLYGTLEETAVQEKVMQRNSISQKKITSNVSQKRALLNQYQASQAQKHKERLQANAVTTRRHLQNSPAPVDNIYFREEPVEATQEPKPGSLRGAGLVKHQKRPSHSQSPTKAPNRVRFRPQDGTRGGEAMASGSNLQQASARKARRPPNLFDKYQNTHGKDTLSMRNRHGSHCQICSHGGSAQRVGDTSQAGSSPDRSLGQEKVKKFRAQKSSVGQGASVSLSNLAKDREEEKGRKKQAAATTQGMQVAQSQRQLRSHTKSPAIHNARKAHLEEQGQVVQFNNNDWKQESDSKFHKVRSESRITGSKPAPGLMYHDTTFGDHKQGRAGASRASHSSKTKNSQATVKIKSKPPTGPPSQGHSSFRQANRTQLTPGQKDLQEGFEKNSQRQSQRGSARGSRKGTIEQSAENNDKNIYKPEHFNREKFVGPRGSIKNAQPPPEESKKGANASTTSKGQERRGQKFDGKPNSTHVSKQGGEAVRPRHTKVLDKRHSIQAPSLAGSASVAKPRLQYSSFHMKDRAALSRNPSQASFNQVKAADQRQDAGAGLDLQAKSHSQHQGGGILKPSSSHGDDMSPLRRRGSPTRSGARASLAAGSTSTRRSKQEEELVARLTKNNDDVPKSLCSGSHNPEVLKEKGKVRFALEQLSNSKRSQASSPSPSGKSAKKRKKPEMVDRAASPIQSVHSIEEVNIEEVAREVREAANDPITFPVETVETQTSAADTLPKKVKEKKERKSLDELAVERDWSTSGIWQLIQKISQLPEAGRPQQAKALESVFFNPMQLEILTEDEAQYNATLLKRRAASHRGNQHEPETNHENEFRGDLYARAFNTVELLSDHLFLAQAAIFDAELRHMRSESMDRRQLSETFGTIEGSLDSRGPEKQKWQEVLKRKSSLIIKGTHYKEIDLSTVIKLLLRCVNLYQAYNDIKKILFMVKQEQELFRGAVEDGHSHGESEDGPLSPIDAIIEELENQDSEHKVLSKEHENTLVHAVKLLRKLSRAISQFLRDHRVFKQFTFRTHDYQAEVEHHAEALGAFLGSPALVPLTQRTNIAMKVTISEKIERRLGNQQGDSKEVLGGAQAEEPQKSPAAKAQEPSAVPRTDEKANMEAKTNTALKNKQAESASSPKSKQKQPTVKKSVQFDVKKNVEIKQPGPATKVADGEVVQAKGSPINKGNSKGEEITSKKTAKPEMIKEEAEIVDMVQKPDRVQDSILSSKRGRSSLQEQPIRGTDPHYETIEEINQSIKGRRGAGEKATERVQPREESRENLLNTNLSKISKIEKIEASKEFPMDPDEPSVDKNHPPAVAQPDRAGNKSEAQPEHTGLKAQDAANFVDPQLKQERAKTNFEVKKDAAESGSSVDSLAPSERVDVSQNIGREGKRPAEILSSGPTSRHNHNLVVEEDPTRFEHVDQASEETVIRRPSGLEVSINDKGKSRRTKKQKES